MYKYLKNVFNLSTVQVPVYQYQVQG